ncbi:hypothetical protein ACJX0J_030111, partial [Zea mays]
MGVIVEKIEGYTMFSCYRKNVIVKKDDKIKLLKIMDRQWIHNHEEIGILEEEEKKDDDIISIYDHYSSFANAITGGVGYLITVVKIVNILYIQLDIDILKLKET